MGSDDRYVMAKHSEVYPSAEELDAVQSLVSVVEGGLKHVSDWLTSSTKPSVPAPTDSTEPSKEFVSQNIIGTCI